MTNGGWTLGPSWRYADFMMLPVLLPTIILLAGGLTGEAKELRRFPAAEAKQGVAVDAEFFYAIDNRQIGKYRKDTGERVAEWKGEKDGPIQHLNSGFVMAGKLYVAHSNFPITPAINTLEIWDATTLKYEGNIPLGTQAGSLTWACRNGDAWFVCYARYAKDGGEGPAGSLVVRYDLNWKQTAAWSFPPDLIPRFGDYSASGGAFGPGGHLYVTGHDAKELYVLDIPEAGGTLTFRGAIPIAAEGQAFAWDPGSDGVLYAISRKQRQVIVTQITLP